MQLPALTDTIVAVSSGWQATPVGIVRLSGADSFGFASRLGLVPPAAGGAQWTEGRLELVRVGRVPVTAYWFPEPRSYTGQNVIELHTPGCLPILRELSAHLIELGARRALPGEFTARAYVAGRLGGQQVEAVLALMQRDQAGATRQAARLSNGVPRDSVAAIEEGITQLLALIEAGIDFVDEEDVRFVTAADVVGAIDRMLDSLAIAENADTGVLRAGRPHVALAGLPNVGKSTLFNALVGHERAIVSPVLGTTRDVLSADVDLDRMAIVLQDCAGLGGSVDELELATHLAAERTAQQADLVLWVHPADARWSPREVDACERIPPHLRLLVCSKADLRGDDPAAAMPISFVETVQVSVLTGRGLTRLKQTLIRHLVQGSGQGGDVHRQGERRMAGAALRRARQIAAGSPISLRDPELVALELRAAHAALSTRGGQALDEELLARIFTQFCVGK